VNDYRQLTGEGCFGLKFLTRQLQEDRLGRTGLDAVHAEEGLTTSGKWGGTNKKKRKGKRDSKGLVEYIMSTYLVLYSQNP
jgi:hypothetical protein